jgi:hypothetical protein
MQNRSPPDSPESIPDVGRGGPFREFEIGQDKRIRSLKKEKTGGLKVRNRMYGVTQ